MRAECPVCGGFMDFRKVSPDEHRCSVCLTVVKSDSLIEVVEKVEKKNTGKSKAARNR